MVLWMVIAAVLVVFLVIAAAMDRRSRRVRGRVGRVRMPGGELSNRVGLRAGEQLSEFGDPEVSQGPGGARGGRPPRSQQGPVR